MLEVNRKSVLLYISDNTNGSSAASSVDGFATLNGQPLEPLFIGYTPAGNTKIYRVKEGAVIQIMVSATNTDMLEDTVNVIDVEVSCDSVGVSQQDGAEIAVPPEGTASAVVGTVTPFGTYTQVDIAYT